MARTRPLCACCRSGMPPARARQAGAGPEVLPPVLDDTYYMTAACPVAVLRQRSPRRAACPTVLRVVLHPCCGVHAALHEQTLFV